MATIREKFRKLKPAPDISFVRQSAWISRYEIYGWVWSDEKNDWSITVAGTTYYGSELTKAQWQEYTDAKLAERPLTASGGLADVYATRYDPKTNQYYFYDVSGNINYSPTNDPYNPTSSNSDVLKTPQYDFSEVIPDILGNNIAPKTPQAGLYNTKEYFDLLVKERKQYKEFRKTTDFIEKSNRLEARATDIVSEEQRIYNLLQKAEQAKNNDGIAVSITSFFVGLGGGSKLAESAILKMVAFGQAQTTDKRLQLLAADLAILDQEYQAIKKFLGKNPSITASSGAGDWLKKNWIWILTAIVSIGAAIYVSRKRKRESEGNLLPQAM